jgi:hypothetical protein
MVVWRNKKTPEPFGVESPGVKRMRKRVFSNKIIFNYRTFCK